MWSGRLAGPARQFFVRPKAVLELAALGALISAAIIIITAVGGAKLLADAGSEALPVVYILLAVVSLPLASAISAALGRWPTPPICRVMCVAALGLALVLRVAVDIDIPAVPQAICITAYALEIVFDTLFWLTVSEYLPTRELKRHTPFLAAAFGLGGVAGGVLATVWCEVIPAEDLLFVGAVLFAVCFLQYRRISNRLQRLGEGDDEEEEAGLIESLRSTFRVFRSFPITGTISVGIFLMSALFCLQDYVAMTIFGETYADEDALASFIAMAYAGYQLVELLLVVAVGGVVLERAGPLARNLIFPLTTLASLSILTFNWSLLFGVLLHLNANAVSNAVFEPVKTLNYAAIPFRALAPVRMMVEGIIYPVGIAASGLALLWLQTVLEPRSILFITLACAVAFLATSAVLGRSFLPSLIASLRVRAILPTDYLQGGRERWFSRADIKQLLAHDDPDARRFGRDLARVIAPDLVAPAGSAAAEAGAPAERSRRRRSHAHRGAPPHGRRQGTVIGRRWRLGPVLWRYAFVLGDRRRQTAKRLERLSSRLEARDSRVRRRAARALAAIGPPAIEHAARHLASPRTDVSEAAIRVLGGIGTPAARRRLRAHLRPLYRRAHLNRDALRALQELTFPPETSATADALANWLMDDNRSILRRVLVVKSALGNRRDINLLQWLARAAEPRVRSNAVEALTSLPTGSLIRPLLPLLETDADRDRSNAASRRPGEASALDPTAALRRLAGENPWVRMLSQRLLGEATDFTPVQQDTSTIGDEAMLDRVLFLKSVPLFRAIPLDDVARLAHMAQPATHGAGDGIVRAGDAVGHVHVLCEGVVEMCLGGSVVETLRAGDCFGEAAVFGQAHATASARAATAVRLLRIPVSLFGDLVAENPEALAPVAADLVRRIAALHADLAERRQDPALPDRPARAIARQNAPATVG